MASQAVTCEYYLFNTQRFSPLGTHHNPLTSTLKDLELVKDSMETGTHITSHALGALTD